MKKNRIIILNSVSALLLQIVNVLNGFIVPKLLIGTFGSYTYGLTASITQFLNYISLFEGGLSSVSMAALYKPLLENDTNKINGIINATRRFFKQIAYIYVIYVVIIGIVYPIIVHMEYSLSYVFLLTIVLGIQLFVQYFFSLSYKILLNADKKVFLISIIQIVTQILTIIATVIGVHYFKDIIWIKLFGSIVIIIQPLLYHYFAQKYFELDAQIDSDNNAISQRWNGFGQNLAYFIHTNTDIAVLTMLSSLEVVSVYMVYMSVVNGLKMIVMSISSSIVPSMGSVIATNDTKKIQSAFGKYSFLINGISTILFFCGIVLINPFISVYTKNFHDAEYWQPYFAVIMLLAEFVYCIRDPFVSVIYASGHFRQTTKYSYLEAAINIVISVVTVKHFGLIGVAIGTLVSMQYRMFCSVYYAGKYILHDRYVKYIKNLVTNFMFFPIAYLFIQQLSKVAICDYMHWMLYAGIVFVSCVTLYAFYLFILFRKELKSMVGSAAKH